MFTKKTIDLLPLEMELILIAFRSETSLFYNKSRAVQYKSKTHRKTFSEFVRYMYK